MLLSEGQMSDYKGAALMLDALPPAKAMLGNRGYDADWFRSALIAKGIAPCIPSKANRKIPSRLHRTLHRQRHRIENLLGHAQGLAAHPHPLRPMRPHLLLSHRHRRYRHLPAIATPAINLLRRVNRHSAAGLWSYGDRCRRR